MIVQSDNYLIFLMGSMGINNTANGNKEDYPPALADEIPLSLSLSRVLLDESALLFLSRMP